MGTFGTVSYNIYCNFTNYGSALQTWALHQAVKNLGHKPVLVDYCPDILADKNPLKPFGNMWDKDEQSKKMVELTMPAIRENYAKFDHFYHDRFERTEKYTSSNFNSIDFKEGLDGFICGGDTIFCPDEFGFDDGYYANYDCMRHRSISYAASFGDPHITAAGYELLRERVQNFKALGIRENLMLPWLKAHTGVPVQRVLDPTLLLNAADYAPITVERQQMGKYLLLYSRRYSPHMEAFAENLAQKNGWMIVEISLRAMNEQKGHVMSYTAGVEEFLSLVKNAEFVVTNSYHGMIFSVQFRRPFAVFSREQCDNKITELLDLLGLRDRILTLGNESFDEIDYDAVHRHIEKERDKSFRFLEMALAL